MTTASDQGVADRTAPDDATDTDEPVPLQFVDLLYAVPVADLAVRVANTHLRGVTASGWTDVGVQLMAITCGWIGHHNNRRKLPCAMRVDRRTGRQFLTLRFPQFLVEILIVVAYFALGTQSYLPHGAGLAYPSEAWKAGWLTIIFALYVIWDVFDVVIALRQGCPKWAARAGRATMVTGTFLVIFGAGMWAGVAGSYDHGRKPYNTVVWFDLALIALLFIYRVVQELALENMSVESAQPELVTA